MVNDADLAPHLLVLSDRVNAGYAIALHIRFTVASRVLRTYPEDWIAEYARDGLVMLDPTLAWAFENQGRIAWDELLPQDETGILARAAAHGLRHGLTVSLLRDGRRSIGGFARTDRPFTVPEVDAIEAAMIAIHDATVPESESRPG